MSSSDSSNPFADFKLWYYTPSIVAGVIFAIIFFVLTGLHLFRLIKNRTWFCIPFVLGALFEAIGYSARAGAHSNLKKIMPYVIHSIFILVAPALFAASIYMILGRLMRATKAEHHSIIPVKYLTKIFVAGDILCFMIQSGGGGLMAKASTQSELKNFEYIILGGLILQILIFGVFVAVAAVFHLRLRKMPTTTTAATVKYQDPISGLNLPWERYMVMLYAVSALIALRNVFRVIEYGMGNTGYLLTHEWTLYVFDGVLMAVVLAVCLVWYVPSMKLRKVQSCEVGMVERQSYQPK